MEIDQAKNFVELSLHECGREICVPEKAIVFSTKHYHLFHYISKGKGTFQIAGNVYHLHAGNLFYIPPESKAEYAPDKEDPWTYEWLGFDGASVPEILKKIGLSDQSPVYLDHDEVMLKPFFDSIVNEVAEKGFLDMFCLGKAYELFGTMLSNVKEDKTSFSPLDSHIENAKEYIRNNFQFSISIEDVSKNVGVTPNYLANIFKSQTNQSPKSYLTEVRMQKAIIYLLTGQYKVKEVGKLVGYPNQLHFSAEFKKHFGLSPLAYVSQNKHE